MIILFEKFFFRKLVKFFLLSLAVLFGLGFWAIDSVSASNHCGNPPPTCTSTEPSACSATACGTVGTISWSEFCTYPGFVLEIPWSVSCSAPACPPACTASCTDWTPTSSCSATACGTTGTYSASRVCTATDCSTSTESTSVACSAPACVCPASCGGWSACSVSCGGGTQSQACTATDCSSYTNSQSCNTQSCCTPSCGNPLNYCSSYSDGCTAGACTGLATCSGIQCYNNYTCSGANSMLYTTTGDYWENICGSSSQCGYFNSPNDYLCNDSENCNKGNSCGDDSSDEELRSRCSNTTTVQYYTWGKADRCTPGSGPSGGCSAPSIECETGTVRPNKVCEVGYVCKQNGTNAECVAKSTTWTEI